jgi:hypothetical protein
MSITGQGDHDRARSWMQTSLLVAVRDLEAKFAGANITVLVSMPGCSVGPEPPLVHKPAFSHATTANQDDLRAVLRALLAETQQ